jgi:hypothetical protein
MLTGEFLIKKVVFDTLVKRERNDRARALISNFKLLFTMESGHIMNLCVIAVEVSG